MRWVPSPAQPGLSLFFVTLNGLAVINGEHPALRAVVDVTCPGTLERVHAFQQGSPCGHELTVAVLRSSWLRAEG